jgi:hypothetical protein
MSKNPKSIVISFRLSPLVIAKAIDGLKNYDKSADITKLSSIIKQTTLHGINYMTNALPWQPSEESQRIVQVLTTQGKQTRSIEENILNQPIKKVIQTKPGSEEKEQVEESFLDKSTKSTVTDFSMPKELKEEIED